jgi:hypothetical protein
MPDNARLMRYATAIARDDLNYLIGPEYPLPAAEHPLWEHWKRTAAVVMKLADEERPPPPGSTEEQIPADLLALIVRRPYTSTACEMARALASAKIRHPDRAYELQMWSDIKHARCRLNNKHSGVLCGCPHHKEKET